MSERAERGLLRSSVGFLLDHAEDGALLDVGDGAFVVEAERAELDGQPVLFVTCRTWLPPHLSSHLLRLPPATDISDMIGCCWMCPPPLRKFRPDGKCDVPTAMVAALGCS